MKKAALLGVLLAGSAWSYPYVHVVGKGFNAADTEPRYCDKVAQVSVSGVTTGQIIDGVAGQNIYICGYQLLWSVATTAAQASIVEGTGSNCVTGQTTVLNTIQAPNAAPTAPNVTFGPVEVGQLFTASAGDALCLKVAGANNETVTGWISYTQN